MLVTKTYKSRSINSSLLICSLYTIAENNKIFKELNLKNDVYLSMLDSDHFSTNSKNFTDFYKLLNKPSLRRFAYSLIKPLLKENYLIFSYNKNVTREVFDETTSLKKYLRKFKHNYCRFFFNQNVSYEYLNTDKNIDTHAVELLFLITGIKKNKS